MIREALFMNDYALLAHKDSNLTCRWYSTKLILGGIEGLQSDHQPQQD